VIVQAAQLVFFEAALMRIYGITIKNDGTILGGLTNKGEILKKGVL
jgi:hypothetical protein